MLAAMPDGYRPASPPPLPELDVVLDDEVEASSSLSPLSPPAPYDGDDPDDTEWEPAAQRQERRRSAFR